MNGSPAIPTGKWCGFLVVLEAVPSIGHGMRYRVRCICGRERTVQKTNLTNGNTKSCGCMKRALISLAIRTHGEGNHRTPEYRAWASMKSRCENPNVQRFPNYGGRGIRVCERWRWSFEAFLVDMGRRPSPNHSLDRIDVNMDYVPDNCRWATSEEQARNKTTSRLIDVGGQKMILAEWARTTGIRRETIAKRIRAGDTGVMLLRAPRRRDAKEVKS